MLGYIKFNTCQVFIGSFSQIFLFVVCHTCLFIIIEMIFYRSTKYRKEFVSSCDREHGWDVIGGVYTVFVRSYHCFTFRSPGIFYILCIVFDIQVGLEFIFGTNVQFTQFSIYTDNRSKSPAGLVTV